MFEDQETTLLFLRFRDPKKETVWEFLVLGKQKQILSPQQVAYWCDQIWDMKNSMRLKDRHTDMYHPVNAEDFDYVMGLPQIDVYEWREVVKTIFPSMGNSY